MEQILASQQAQPIASLIKRRFGIGFRFGLVTFIAVLVIGATGIWTSAAILRQISSFVQDEGLLDSLDQAREAMANSHRERRTMVRERLQVCIDKHIWPNCDLAYPYKISDTAPQTDSEEMKPHWISESELLVPISDQWHTLTFEWAASKQAFDRLSNQYAVREHLQELIPNMRRSFALVFAAIFLAAIALSILITYYMSHQLTARFRALIDYTAKIGRGERPEIPQLAGGADEVGWLSESLNKMADELEHTKGRLIMAEKMASWQTVARKLAHEIKNPLTPITVVAGELDRFSARVDGAMAEALRESSRILTEEAQALSRMVKEFSSFARLPKPNMSQCNLANVVSDFVQRNLIDSGPIFTVNTDGCDDYPVNADAAMLHQIFHNLVNNARLAKLSERVTVQFSISRLEHFSVVDVSDNASGVPDSIRHTLFDAYVTTRSTGEGEKGMGLGLTIARKIANDHNGSLELLTTGAQGTTFRLKIPMSIV